MADNKLKFLDIVGLTQLVSEIKTRIGNAVTEATNKTLIGDVTFTNADGKITINQGTDNVKTVTLDFATTDKNGLMTKEQVTELGRLNTAKLDKVALRIDGTDHASLFTTTTVNGKQVAVIDYTTNVGDKTSIQAPTAGAVATALDTKVSTETYNARVKELDDAIKENTSAIEKKVDADDYAKDKAAINKTITDGLALKLDSSTYTTDKQAQTLKDQNQDSLITKHETMLYTTGTTATNVYNKTEVDTAIADAKKSILTGDATGEIDKAYDTIKEIADWITNDETGAANLAGEVAALKNTTAGHTTSIEGLQDSVKTIIGEDGKSGLIGGLDTRLGTAETDIENLEKELDTANTGVKARLTALETELTKADGIKARLTTAEGEIDQLQLDYQTIDSTINGTDGLKATKADKTAAMGSVETVEGTNAYDLVFKSVSGTEELGRVSFQVFTAAEITALFA